MSDDKQDRIRKRAHAIWEGQGRPEGQDREHWAQATREIEAEENSTKKPAAKAAAKAKAPATKAPAAKKPAGKAKSAK